MFFTCLLVQTDLQISTGPVKNVPQHQSPANESAVPLAEPLRQSASVSKSLPAVSLLMRSFFETRGKPGMNLRRANKLTSTILMTIR